MPTALSKPAAAAILATRPHFQALDGLRGIAALAVVTFHFSEMAIYDYSKLYIGHGFLAVDFFFCLSGFVLGYAYDARIATMGLWPFLQSRLIRLHPMVIFGSVLGLIALFADPLRLAPLTYSAGRIALMFLASIFLIPYPAMHERGYNLFSLNAPAWSLFWEYVASFFYGAVLYKFAQRWLWVSVALAAVVLCLAGAHASKLSGGWSGPTFWYGGVRVAYSFLAGLLLYRLRWVLPTRLGFTPLALLLLLAFVMPYARGGWVREAAVILFYFPLLVALGAGATLSPRSQRFCTLAGDLSYPLYMTHYAVIWIFGSYYDRYHPQGLRFALTVTAGVLTMVAFAYAVMRLYDIPLRASLRSQRRAAAAASFPVQ